jgi:two-component system, chemotaxis family, protein-glutamate methylesterase/glutaminase
MIRVVVIEDSPVSQALIRKILESDPDIRVVGTAPNGRAGLEMIAAKRPDLVTMDIHMPVMDGYQTTRAIMETQPLPIVVVSASWDPSDVNKTFRAMEAGAVAFLEKPIGIGSPHFEASATRLLKTVRSMSKVKVVKRRPLRTRSAETAVEDVSGERAPVVVTPQPIDAVAIGASTGGPIALQSILSKLPPNLGAPVLVVQHICDGFTAGFVDWLNVTCPLTIRVAQDGVPLLPGYVLVAPAGRHLLVDRSGSILLSDEILVDGHRPSVTSLFQSVAEAFGRDAVGVLLTGMGRDGVAGMQALRKAGAVTIAQDKESSVVHGMPGEAIRADAAMYVLPPDEIAAFLTSLVVPRPETRTNRTRSVRGRRR